MVMDFKSYFSGLKKTVEGKDDYYFLVNDTNNEIRQHYDSSYNVKFDLDKFVFSLLSKQSYVNARGMTYNFFIVPDKSITMRKYLPFETDEPIRITDLLTEYIYDLHDIITEDDVLKNDTHITPLSSLKIVPYVISKIHNESYDQIQSQISSSLKEEIRDHKGDLFFDVNWSYPKDERFKKNAHVDLPFLVPIYDVTEVNLEDIPQEFRKVSNNQSFYYKNPNSISDKKALILRDSTTNFLMSAFISYYREVFFYWDRWYFNKELVEWFKPDDVIEIRTERFLNDPSYPTIENNFIVPQKIITDNHIFRYDGKKIQWNFTLMNSYNMLLNTSVDVLLDDELLDSYEIVDGKFSFEEDFSNYNSGLHIIKLVIKATDTTDENVLMKNFILNPKIDLSSLKSTLRGKNNIYFLANDSNHELLQHYFYDYDSRFNLHDFKASLDSKRAFFNDKNIKFGQFIIPDKSVLLRQMLPFETGVVLRHADKLTNYYYDLSSVLQEDDYLANDTKITDHGALKCVYLIISKLFSDRNNNYIKEELQKRIFFKEVNYPGDLFNENGWSYEFDDEYENNKLIPATISEYRNEDDIKQLPIPIEFMQFNKTKSLYYRNENPIEDKKVLIITDKAIYPFIKLFTSFFSEVFFYHDYWYFNYDLIDYLKPDIVLEIRSERTLDNALTNRISDDMKTIIPITVTMDCMEVNDKNLHIKAYCEDLRKLPLNVAFKVFIDEEVVCEDVLQDGCLEFNHSLNHYEHGSHELKIRIDEGYDTKAKLITQNFEVK